MLGRVLGVGMICGFAIGCASSYEPIVDMKGVDAARYQADLDECRQYADHVDVGTSAGTGAAIGAAIGAATGAAVGAITGSPGTGAAVGAAGGGTTGLFGGGLRGGEKQRQVIRNCLRGRGYSVLG